MLHCVNQPVEYYIIHSTNNLNAGSSSRLHKWGNRMFLIAREGGREALWLSAGENLCATSSTFAGRRHMIGKVVTGCVAILPYHTATQDRGSECRDFGFISRIVTALIYRE